MEDKKSLLDILKYLDTREFKINSQEKLNTMSRLLLAEKVRKNLIFFQSEENKKKDKITFRYYVKGEIRANPDGSEPVYPDDSNADLKKDKFYESKEYDWLELMNYTMMFIRGDELVKELLAELTAKAVSDIVSQIEKNEWGKVSNE